MRSRIHDVEYSVNNLISVVLEMILGKVVFMELNKTLDI